MFDNSTQSCLLYQFKCETLSLSVFQTWSPWHLGVEADGASRRQLLPRQQQDLSQGIQADLQSLLCEQLYFKWLDEDFLEPVINI